MNLNQEDVLGMIIATILNAQQRHVSDAQYHVLFKILTYLYRQIFQLIYGLYLQSSTIKRLMKTLHKTSRNI